MINNNNVVPDNDFDFVSYQSLSIKRVQTFHLQYARTIDRWSYLDKWNDTFLPVSFHFFILKVKM